MKATQRFVVILGVIHSAIFLFCSAANAQSGTVIAQYPDIVGLAASYNEDDGYRVVIIARRNGEIRELFYKTQNGALSGGVGNSVVAQISGVSAVAALYARDDSFRIVLAATTDGALNLHSHHFSTCNFDLEG